jgi:hypothetical protein
MSVTKVHNYEIRHRALLEAIRCCGGVAAYGRRIKVSRARASNWCNKLDIKIPYEYVLLTEELTQVSIERLSPFTEEINKSMRRYLSGKSPYINRELNDILIGKQVYVKHLKPDRPIIVGTDGVLISGLAQMEIYKAAGIKKSQVMVLDLEALFLETRPIEDMNIHLLLISERVAIGLRLEQLISSRMGRPKNPNLSSREKELKNNPKTLPKWGEIVGRKDVKVAHMIGFSTNTYYRAKQTYLKGNAELIDALDCKDISIARGAKQIISLEKQQRERV